MMESHAKEDAGIRKLQALFRGKRGRELHVQRVQKNLAWSPYMASHPDAVLGMLELAGVTQDDVVVDIGSGDGRVLFAAMQAFHAKRAIGIEIDPILVAESKKKQIQLGYTDNQVQIVQGDWMEASLHEATVITLFFLPHPTIAPLLMKKLRPGTRVVTYVFEIKEWDCIQSKDSVSFQNIQIPKVRLYIIPEEIKDDPSNHHQTKQGS